MSGSTLGKLFSVTSFGESHGPAIGCVVDGCPPGMALTEADIQTDLDRRKPGTSRHVTQRHEEDKVEILSGVFEGLTTGTPIALLIRNVDARSKDYSKIKDMFRPGHADYTYWQKYGIRDYRGGGRQSARETAVRVAAGAVARKWLIEKFGIVIRGYMSQLGSIVVPFKSWDGVYDNPFFVADESYVAQLEEFMDKLRKSGDSVGAQITTIASGVPVGWGEPVYDKPCAEPDQHARPQHPRQRARRCFRQRARHEQRDQHAATDQPQHEGGFPTQLAFFAAQHAVHDAADARGFAGQSKQPGRCQPDQSPTQKRRPDACPVHVRLLVYP
jgi:hypothetical protein